MPVLTKGMKRPPVLCLELTLVLKYLIYSYNFHYVKSVRIQNYSSPYFPTFGLNKERYFVSLRIQSEYGKIQTRITPNTEAFYAVFVNYSFSKQISEIQFSNLETCLLSFSCLILARYF